MMSAFAKRDAVCGSDDALRMMCLSDIKRNTSHHRGTKWRNIISAQADTSCVTRKNATYIIRAPFN